MTWDDAASDHVNVFSHRTRSALARGLTAAVLVLGGLAPAAVAHAQEAGQWAGRSGRPPAAVVGAPKPAPSAKPTGTGSANDGAGDGRITFGMTTASGGTTDPRGFIAVNAPPGAVLHDDVAVLNLSDAPLTADVYAADVTNAADGSLAVASSTDTKQLAGGWVSLGQETVQLAAQSSRSGPGLQVVPVTITIPTDAEPGDHLAAVLSSVTAQGKPGQNAPAINLEHRVGVRVYVTVQGDIRPGLTVTKVHTRFRPGSAFGTGSLEVEYTLTNSGNVRLGVHPTVRATGPFGLAPHGADGTDVAELLPHSSVTQTVTLAGVFPLVLENVVVSAAAIPAQGASDPRIGTVHASSWTWLWTWLALVVLLVLAGLGTWSWRRRRRNRPGVWGPPEGLWDAPGTRTGPPAAEAPASAPGTEHGVEPEPVR